MFVFITGGSKCGKSSLAERLLEQYSLPKYYIATMQPFGEEARAAIERHRKQRAGKGYVTIEKYTDLGEISLPKPGGAVLLECMGNLCANEMFSEECGEQTVIEEPAGKEPREEFNEERGEQTVREGLTGQELREECWKATPRKEPGVQAAGRVVTKIVRDVEHLQTQTEVLVIVSNQVGSDGILYTPETTSYIEAMGRINAALCVEADVVVESVYGIPIVHKGRLPW